MAISIEQIKELRERTQAGMSDCKSALSEAGGDMDKAIEIIMKKGLAKAAKRAGRVATEGEVRASVFDAGRQAAMVEVNIETDFSARNDKFKALVGRALKAVEHAAAATPLEGLSHEGKKLSDEAAELTAVIGEKITLRRYAKAAVEKGKHGFCASYIHPGGKIGVILAIEASAPGAAEHPAARTFAEETAMQIAAMNPIALVRDDVDQAAVAKQREIFEAQMREDPKPKPEAVWPKIIDGKIAKWFQDVVLLDQESAQHKKPIRELLAEAGKAAGAELRMTRFVRFELGEGIEKKTESITEGVAQLIH